MDSPPAQRFCEKCGAAYYAKGLCMRCYYAKRRHDDPERARLAGRRYWAAHREESKSRAHRWYEQHRAEKLAASRAYKQAHRDAINAARRSPTLRALGTRPADALSQPVAP